MTTQTETATITNSEALAKAVKHAQEADRLSNDVYRSHHDRAAAHAVISQAFTALAQATTPQPAPAQAAETEPKRRLWLPTRRKNA